MNISKRLEAVATLVDIGSRVIDVGCDHAYLDIYLTLNNDNKCIATDINKNALEMAQKNIKKHKLEKKIEIKLADGLTDIKVKKSDNIVISGMGTFTILDILKTNKLSNTLIISSNNNIDILRREVINLGYYIDSEIFLIDKGKPYIIIKFIEGLQEYKKIDIKLGPVLKNNISYLEYNVNKYKRLIKQIPNRKILLKLKYLFIILVFNILKLKKHN